MNDFAQRIITLRKELSMTQEQLAQELGITAQAVSKWETGQSYPDITLLPKLADQLFLQFAQQMARQLERFAHFFRKDSRKEHHQRKRREYDHGQQHVRPAQNQE